MYRRVLIPVDGSSYSEEILPYALAVRHATGAELALVAVLDARTDDDEATTRMRGLATRLQADPIVVTGNGSVARAILSEADRVDGTLVAMTTHGRGGLAEAVLGSVAHDVVRAAHRPVLVYRPGTRPDAGPDGASRTPEPAPINLVMLPLDGSELAQQMEEPARALARALGARLLIVQVLRSDVVPGGQVPEGDILPSSYVSRRARALSRGGGDGADTDWEVLYGHPVDAMAAYLDGRPDAVVAMATNGRSGLRAAVFGSVTAGMVRRSAVPVLVQRP